MAAPTLTSAATDSSTTPTTEVVVEEEPTTTTDTTDTTEPLTPTMRPGRSRGATGSGRCSRISSTTARSRPPRQTPSPSISPPIGRSGARHRGGRPGFDGEVLAGLLGIDVDTLRTELRSGKTVAEIATEQGVEVQTVIDALVAEARSHLELSVDNGRLTQEEADAKLAELTERITERVNEGRPTPD